MTILIFFFALLFLLSLYSVILGLSWLWTLMAIRVSQSDNDSEKAIKAALDLLSKATTRLELYDDGDKDTENSLYDDSRFIEGVKEKLENYKDFSVLCLFNSEDSLRFKDLFKDEDRVSIYVRQSQDRPEDTHYKIIDNGKMAYLSKHRLGSEYRSCKTVDCSKISGKRLEKTNRLLFDDYRKDLSEFKKWEGGATNG